MIDRSPLLYGPQMFAKKSLKPDRDIYLMVIVLNVIYVTIEMSIGFWQNSLALIADALHNITDILNILVVWLCAWMSNRPSSLKRTYGFRRLSLLSSLYIGMSMIGAALMIAWQGFDRLSDETHTTISGALLMGVASVGIVINFISAWLFFHKNRLSKDLNDRVLSIELFYDFLVSMVVVLGGVLIQWLHWQWIDSLLALIVAAFILWSGVHVVREVLNLLLDAVPTHIDTTEVRDLILQFSGIDELHDLHIWAMSTRHISLSAHVTASAGLSDQQRNILWHQLANRFGIDHITIQVEHDATLCPQKEHSI